MASKSVIHPKGRLARLHFLSGAIGSLTIPIEVAETLVAPADFPAFVEELDVRVRALADLFDRYLVEHPGALEYCEDPGLGDCVKMELAHTRKSLDLINRIGKAGRKEDAGKSNVAIVREVIRTAALGHEIATDFTVEIDELRNLRSGELKLRSALPNQSAKHGRH